MYSGPDRYYHDQELLEMAYGAGRYCRQQKKEPEPLKYVAWLVQYYAPYRSEALYQQVVEWYQAGYRGLVRSPGQWQAASEE
jgi:hypothetical protein